MPGHDDQFEGRSAYVLVLGDIGRSPRMCNHSVSLANVGFDVTLMGYDQGSNLIESVRNSPKISVSPIRTYPQWMSNWMPRPVSLILKAIWQFVTLFFFALPHWRQVPDIIIVQNPPSIPTLIVSVVYASIHRRTKVVLDWHNYGYSILQMGLSPNHPLVLLAKYIESTFGPRVAAAFCVSKAMKRDLYNKWNIDATVLYDRPLDTFRPCSVEEKHHLLSKLADIYPAQINANSITESDPETGVVRLRPVRPAILVSSTSWTKDEDFSILFEALDMYESRCGKEGSNLPYLICVITGKGPEKEYYRNLIAERQWECVKVVMPWLEPQDYPLMLGSADLGVCLHMSSSGVDLPMKVVDMFGCGLPVVAKKFDALPELVKDGINGILFDTPEELSDKIVQWFEEFPNASYERRRRPFTNQIERFRTSGWSDHWRAVALPVFQNLL